MAEQTENTTKNRDAGEQSPLSPLAEAPAEKSTAEYIAETKAVFRRLGPVGVLAIIAASFPAIGGIVLLGLMKWTSHWLQENGELGLAVYVLGFAVMAGLALLPTYAQAVVAGFAFGPQAGIAAALCGIAGAATIGYAIARRASGDRVVQIIEEYPKFKAVYEALLGGGIVKTFLIVTLLRVPPNSPFAITNLVMAATRIRPAVYLLGTIVGIAPRTIVAVVIGAGMSELDFSQVGNRWLFAGGIIVALIVLGIIGTIANRAITKITGQQANNANPSTDKNPHD